MSRYLTEIAEQTLKEEQELVQTSSDLTSVFIDNEIKLLASEELKSYIYQVECSNAIGQRLHELANEMVEEQSSNELKKAVQECIEVVAFDVSMEAWLQEFVEKIIASEARGIAAQ